MGFFNLNSSHSGVLPEKVWYNSVSNIADHLQISFDVTDFLLGSNQKVLVQKMGEMPHFYTLFSTKLPSH